MEVLAVPFLLLVGALLSVQSGANVQLSAGAGGPIRGSALQLGLGAALLVVLSAIVGTPGAPGLFDDAEPWHLIGGLGSAVYITAGILLFPRLGAVVTVALFITGQMLTSLVLDATGWLGVAGHAVDAAALGGAAAVLIGVALIARAQAGASSTSGSAWVAFALVAGAVLPLQGAINAQLRADLDAPITAGAWSFVVAALAMLFVLAGTSSRPASPAQLDRVPWWGWLGGLCGATYVTAVFLLIPEIGVAPTIGLTVAGQQLASVFVDAYGLLRLPRRPVTGARLGGVAILLAGVALIQAG
jgi:transporter family-2 protein